MNDDIYYNIFENNHSYRKWDNHIEFAAKCRNITEDKRNEWMNALAFLRAELGEHFLKSGGENNPMVKVLTGKAEWEIAELIMIANTLRKLKEDVCSYDVIRKKIISGNKFKIEGCHFLEIARMLHSSGLEVSFPIETQKNTSPDMQVTNPEAGEVFFAEVSVLNESEPRNCSGKNYETLLNELDGRGKGLLYSCAQLRYIRDDEMPDVLTKIRELKERAFNETAILYHTDDKIRLAVSHYEKSSLLSEWMAENNCRKGLLGMPLDFDETARIANKIKKEEYQTGNSGIIYIPVSPLYFFAADIEQVFLALQECQKQFTNVFGVTIFSHHLENASEVEFVKDGNVYSVKSINAPLTRNLVFVRNECYNGVLSPDSIAKIYQSLQ